MQARKERLHDSEKMIASAKERSADLENKMLCYTVKESTAKTYTRAVEKFMKWLNDEKKAPETAADMDLALLTYMGKLLFDDELMSGGSVIFNALNFWTTRFAFHEVGRRML